MKHYSSKFSPLLTLFFAVAVAPALLFAGNVVAEDGDDNSGISMCAAIMPCTLDGEVLVEFDNGPCAEVYRAQCAIAQSGVTPAPKRTERYRIAQCRNSSRRMQHQYERKLNLLRNQVRSYQRSLASRN